MGEARWFVELDVEAPLHFLLAARHRNGTVRSAESSSTLSHVIQAAGIPMTEVGDVTQDGRPARSADRCHSGAVIGVAPMPRPQRGLSEPVTFLLDVHLGSLSRRLRLLGLDAAYRNDASDDDLVRQAVAERRVLLSQDRGLLCRKAIPAAAFVRGAGVRAQIEDVLDRFAPILAPWSRCSACNGVIAAVGKHEVASQLLPGTRATFHEFARCRRCGRVFWRGAHAARLTECVESAQAVVARRRAQAACGQRKPQSGMSRQGAGQAPEGQPGAG